MPAPASCWSASTARTRAAEHHLARFTPRRPGSIWSSVNTRRAGQLEADGRMAPAGLTAWKKRIEAKTAIYAYEQRETAKLPRAYEKLFRARPGAWDFYSAQPPWYRRLAAWYVISAKKEETRLKRIERLITDSAARKRIGPQSS